MATGQCSSRTGVVVVAWQQQILVPILLSKDLGALKNLLSSTSPGHTLTHLYIYIISHNLFLTDDLQPLLLEHTSGGCNILHVLSLLGSPPVPSHCPAPFSSGPVGERRRGMAARTTPRSGVLREIMKQAMALATGSGPAGNLGGELYLELSVCFTEV